MSGTVLAVAITLGAITAEKPWQRWLLLGSALGITQVSRLASGARATQDRILQDYSDISDAARQQLLFQGMTQSDNVGTVLELAPMDAQGAHEALLSPTLETYDLANLSKETHVAIIGESGSGKSYLAQHLINTTYPDSASIIALDTDAKPGEWGVIKVVGGQVNVSEIKAQMLDDLEELKTRGEARGRGEDVGGDVVRIVEEFSTLDAEIQDNQDTKSKQTISNKWLKQMLRRGRKYNMTAWLVSQEFSVEALGIKGEGALRKAFTVCYLGKQAYAQLNKTDKDHEVLKQWLDSQERPCLVDVGGQLMPAIVPNIASTSTPTTRAVEVHQPAQESDSLTEAIELSITDAEASQAMPAVLSNPTGVLTIHVDDDDVEDFDIHQMTAEYLHKMISSLRAEGVTKTNIIKKYLKMPNKKYRKGKALWEKLEETYGPFE